MPPPTPVEVLPPKQGERRWAWARRLLLILYAVLILATFRDYGMSWDQPVFREFGLSVVNYYASGGEDESALTHLCRRYGGYFEIAAHLLEKSTGLGWVEARNLTSALLGLLGLYAAMQIGTAVFSPATGVLSGIFLLATPAYYGHSFMNPKDLPFAALMLMGLWQIVQLDRSLPALSPARLAATGCWFGLAMGVRIGGGILLVVLLLAVARRWWLARGATSESARLRPAQISLALALVAVVAWVVMLLGWPYALEKPVFGPYLAFKEFSQFWWGGQVYFEGALWFTRELPVRYLPSHFLQTMPEFVLLGLALGVVAWLLQDRNARARFWSPAALALVAMAVLPFLLVIALRSNVYDGLRHVLFAIPPAVILAAAGCTAFARLEFTRRYLRLAQTGLAALVLAVVADLVSLHPFEYLYFNRAVGGGIGQANRRYDLDYWALGLHEAALWAQREYTAGSDQGVTVYLSQGEREQVDYYLEAPGARGAFRRAKDGEPARLAFLIRRWRQMSEPTEGRVVHVVRRQGVPLVDVVELPAPQSKGP